MKPGATTRPLTFSTSLPCNGAADTAAIFAPRMPTFRTASKPDAGSITRPPASTTSYCCANAETPASSIIEILIILPPDCRASVFMIKLLLRRLLIRPGAIGDCVLSLPALECLRAASTGIDLLVLPGIEPPFLLVERLKSFDSIVSWYGANRKEFRDGVAARGLPFRFFPALPPPDERAHAADYFLRVAGGEAPGIPRIH